MGLGDLNEEKKIVSTLSDEDKEMDKFILKIFSLPVGKKVLEFLNQHYIQSIHKPVKQANGTINSDMTTYGLYQKEGQKLLIKNIEMRMERAKSG